MNVACRLPVLYRTPRSNYSLPRKKLSKPWQPPTTAIPYCLIPTIHARPSILPSAWHFVRRKHWAIPLLPYDLIAAILSPIVNTSANSLTKLDWRTYASLPAVTSMNGKLVNSWRQEPSSIRSESVPPSVLVVVPSSVISLEDRWELFIRRYHTLTSQQT